MIAFLKRDIQSMLSYRFRFFMQFVSLIFSIAFVFFIGKTFSGTISLQLERYGNDYFAFAILGLALSSFVSTGLYSFSSQIRNAQVQGTLEALLMTPTSVYTILIGNSFWSFLRSFIESTVYITASILILGLSVTFWQILQVILVLVLTFGSFLSIGLVSASFILVFKQGNPINTIFGASSFFLGGILFPVEILPSWIHWLSNILPLTHSVRLIREILLVSIHIREVGQSLFSLALFILLIGPLALFIFHHALKRAKRDGSLVQY